MAFGENVRRAREQAGYTQAQLGILSDALEGSLVSKIERGERPPTLVTLLCLAHALKVPPVRLLTGLSAPLREHTASALIAEVDRTPGIRTAEVSRRLVVHEGHVSVLAARLALEGRIRKAQRRLWPADEDEQQGIHGMRPK